MYQRKIGLLDVLAEIDGLLSKAQRLDCSEDWYLVQGIKASLIYLERYCRVMKYPPERPERCRIRYLIEQCQKLEINHDNHNDAKVVKLWYDEWQDN